jgi:outer membrane protein assembly factor BamB
MKDMFRTNSRIAVIAVAMFLGAVMSAETSSVAAQTSAGMGDDWPQWRGPAHDGIVPAGPKLLDAWPTNGPKRVWKSGPLAGYPDGGTGSIVVSGGRVFVYADEACSTPARIITAAYCTDHGWAPDMPENLVQKVEASRESVERKKTKDMGGFTKDFLEKLDPEQAGKFGVAISNRLAQGENNWTWATMTQMGKSIGKEFRTGDQVREMVKDTHYAHSGSLQSQLSGFLHQVQQYKDTVICLDAATGMELWRKAFPGTYAAMWGQNYMASGTPAISGGRCYVAGSQGLYCLNVKDGAEVWHVMTRFSNSSPLVMDDAVFVLAEPSGKPINTMGGALCKYEAASGKLLWQSKVGSEWGSSVVPWLTGGKLCLVASARGGTVCLDAGNGTVMWEAHAGSASATPVIRGDILVVNDSKLVAFKISTEKAELLWKTEGFGSDRQGSPLIFQDHVYVNGGGLGCVDLKTGAIMWRGPGTQLSSPVEADGKIFAYFNGGPGEVQWGCSLLMCKATPDKYQELGRFVPNGSSCSSPTIAGGRLYLRQTDGVACYDIESR